MSTLAPAQLHRASQGRRYSEAERDAAFLVYAGAGKQNFVTTSFLTRVHRNTLSAWAEEDDWVGRLEASGTAAQDAVAVAKAMFPHLLTAASGRWLEILSDPEANQNAQAKLIEMAYGMYGMVVPKQSMSVVQHLTDQGGKTTISLKDLESLDPDQLEQWTGQAEEDEGVIRIERRTDAVTPPRIPAERIPLVIDTDTER